MIKTPVHSLYLRGGLGNILFQLSMARQLMLRYGGSFRVSHKYTGALDDPLVLQAIAHVCELTSLELSDFGLRHHSLELLKKLCNGNRLILESTDLERLFTRSRRQTRFAASGYFQNFEALEPSIAEIGNLMRVFLKRHVTLSDDLPTEFIGLHVRLGDYSNLDSLYGSLTSSYYSMALERLAESGEQRSLPVVVVSNDIEGAKLLLGQRLAGWPLRFAPVSDSPLTDLATLASARFLVAPNSTFSWWASIIGKPVRAFLPAPFLMNERKDKRVNLFAPGIEFIQR